MSLYLCSFKGFDMLFSWQYYPLLLHSCSRSSILDSSSNDWEWTHPLRDSIFSRICCTSCKTCRRSIMICFDATATADVAAAVTGLTNTGWRAAIIVETTYPVIAPSCVGVPFAFDLFRVLVRPFFSQLQNWLHRQLPPLSSFWKTDPSRRIDYRHCHLRSWSHAGQERVGVCNFSLHLN